MNARIERAMNFQNLGARIMRNEALDQKIWALEACRGKMVFIGGSCGSSGIFGVVGGSLAQKTGLLWNLGIFQGFLWIFGVFGALQDQFVIIFLKPIALL
jgi:hypothetical protein